MFKKFAVLLMTGAMAVSMMACGSSSSSSSAQEESAAEAATESVAATEASSGSTAGEPAEIQVFIAASLNDAVQELADTYNETHTNVKIILNADSSGTLMTQIEEGYACDIFFSAATKQMKQLEEGGFIVDGTRVDLLNNQVVLIAGKDNGTKVTGLANIGDAASIALADGSVPVGKYTRQAMVNAGMLEAADDVSAITTQDIMDVLGTEINECANVSKVKEAVKEGSCEVGTVYYTDAYSVISDVDIIETLSKDLTGDIIYPVARVSNAEADELQAAAADDFYKYLLSDEAAAVFEKYLYTMNK